MVRDVLVLRMLEQCSSCWWLLYHWSASSGEETMPYLFETVASHPEHVRVVCESQQIIFPIVICFYSGEEKMPRLWAGRRWFDGIYWNATVIFVLHKRQSIALKGREMKGTWLSQPWYHLPPCRHRLLYDHDLWHVPDLEGSWYLPLNGCMAEVLRRYMAIVEQY